MLSYLDTSVLFPALAMAHPNHRKCRSIFETARKEGDIITLATHTFAEAFNNLTRRQKMADGSYMQPYDPVDAADVLRTLRVSVRVLTIEMDVYQDAFDRCGRLGLSGPIIYDAIQYEAALVAGSDKLYTANLKDYTRLVEPEDAMRILGV